MPKEKLNYKNTTSLPQTDFPMRANAKENDPKMLQRWQQENLTKKTFEHNKGKEKFILHDGPPYANGHIHLGHSYNKILKDIICKSQRMQKKHVPVTPGWDCHGLPIELKVSKEHKNLSAIEFKKECRKYAQKWVDTQKQEFKKLGVLMDFDNPYLTMNYKYEAAILRSFGKFVEKKYIERKNKTVPWCPSCQTVLASAEIEHQERKDPSIYVEFPLSQVDVDQLFPSLNGKEVNLLIWTTTPWTLPLNRAVILKPKADYVVLNINEKYVILGAALADKLCASMEVEKNIVETFKAEALENIFANHPFVENLKVPIIFDSFVSLEDGTACVHSAPGCGPEDYEIGIRNNLEIFSPLSSDGKYTEEIVPKELNNMPVSDGQIWVIKKLASTNRLLHKKSIRHSYPHCWRCRGGLIFRATKQWFCDLSQANLKEKALQASDSIKTIPKKSINSLKAAVGGRLEWCLSRQRSWGVPIVALICNHCSTPHITPELIEKIAQKIEEHGIEYWDTVNVQEVSKNISCSSCSKNDFTKEKDILDVWFDSGVTHAAVLKEKDELQFPADVYLEGKDQHRGWFQSSLLTSVALYAEPSTKTIITHGYTVDDKGRKMSKSLGNVVAPQEVIDKLGTDGLRLWASSIDVESEAVVSDILIKNVQQVLRKVRNTCRFLLANIYDFDIKKDAVPFDELSLIDQYALQTLKEFNNKVIADYNDYNITAVFHALGDYCSAELSSFYMDIVKDRLYVEKANGKKRRSAQTVYWYILDTLTKLIAPIMSFTAEQISDFYQKNKTESIHLQNFADLDIQKTKEANWNTLKIIRSAILKAIEVQREQNIMKHSLEAQVTVYFDMQSELLQPLASFFDLLQKHNEVVHSFFKEFLIVSQFTIADNKNGLEESEIKGLFVNIEKAEGVKCPRCWHWSVSEHEDGLCSRCINLI